MSARRGLWQLVCWFTVTSVCRGSVFTRFSSVVLMTDTRYRVNNSPRPYSSPSSTEEDSKLGLSVNMLSEKMRSYARSVNFSFELPARQ